MKSLPLQYILSILICLIISCRPQIELDKESASSYAQKGKQIVSESYGAVSAALHRYLNHGNVKSAIGACNLSAIPLLDSISTKYNVNIRRTSLQIRNPFDTPKDYEMVMLKEYSERPKEKMKSEVKVINNNKIAFFSPIFVNATCLKCHGEIGKDLNDETYSLISNFYPEDKAINYKDGDFRGMWSVTFLDD